MPTGDGLLLRAPAGWWGAGVLAGISDAAARFGNGVVEVTARGSVQIRGLDEDGAVPVCRGAGDARHHGRAAGTRDPLAAEEARAIAAAIVADWRGARAQDLGGGGRRRRAAPGRGGGGCTAARC
jgi:precorrin-3B synthase